MKASILYVKPKFMTTKNHDTMLNIDCDYGVYFFNIPKDRIVQKKVDQHDLAPIKVWFVGRVYRMRRKSGNC